jgi:hypothetical protein
MTDWQYGIDWSFLPNNLYADHIASSTHNSWRFTELVQNRFISPACREDEVLQRPPLSGLPTAFSFSLTDDWGDGLVWGY